MSLSIIVACDLNGGIGNKGNLLFSIKEDMKRFKELTTNHTVIMGHKTQESLPNKFLYNRHNIVLTTNANRIQTFSPNESLIFKDNIDELIEEYKDSDEEVFIIGGGFIYKQFLPYCNKIYLTVNFDKYEADTFFKFNKDEWELDELSKVYSKFGFYNYRRKQVKG